MTERTRGMELTVKLQVFEGPLDLLLYLLEKNKVNIYDIPIVEITEQYMEYIREMKRQDLEAVSYTHLDVYKRQKPECAKKGIHRQ